MSPTNQNSPITTAKEPEKENLSTGLGVSNDSRELSLRANRPTVAITDFFHTTHSRLLGMVSEKLLSDPQLPYDVDGDGKNELMHGEITKAILEAHGVSTTIEENLNAPGKVVGGNPENAKATHLNCSYGLYYNFEQLSFLTAMEITPQNIGEKRAEILDSLEPMFRTGEDGAMQFRQRCIAMVRKECERNNNESELGKIMIKHFDQFESLKATVEKIRTYEKNLENGGPILVVAAGNLGPTNINIFSLTKGSITVGGLDKAGKIHPESGTALVSKWAPHEISIKATKEGLDLNSDGRADIPWEKTSSKGTNFDKSGTVVVKTLKGTSLSTPVVAAALAKSSGE